MSQRQRRVFALRPTRYGSRCRWCETKRTAYSEEAQAQHSEPLNTICPHCDLPCDKPGCESCWRINTRTDGRNP